MGNDRLITGIVLAVAVAAYYLIRTDIVLGDPDIWWHVTSGLDMLTSFSFPTQDHYSYTFEGSPWIAKEWLSQTVLALAYRSFGWSGVAFISTASAALAMMFLYMAMARDLRPVIAATVTLLVAVVLTQIVIARPHVFTLPIAVLFTVRLFRAADAQAPPPFWLLGLITLWANLHGSFTLAFAIAGLAFMHLLIEGGLGKREVLVKWIAFGALAPVAALINPYGWTPFRINLDMMAGNESMALITEWQPFNAGREVLVEYGLIAALGVLIGLRTRLGWGKVIFILFTLHMFLAHIRFVYVFFLLVPVVIAVNVGKAYPEMASRMAMTGRRWPVAGAITTAAVAVFAVLAAIKPFAPPERRSIEAALKFVRTNGLAAGPVLNGYNLGGVLIFNGIKTYIDGRAEQLFRGPFITEFIDSTGPGGEKLLKAMIERSGATWTIMPVADARNAMMSDMAGWRKAYDDPNVMIFVRQ